jgi:hypothetical protein
MVEDHIINNSLVALTSKCRIQLNGYTSCSIIPNGNTLEYTTAQEDGESHIVSLDLGDGKIINRFKPIRMMNDAVIIYPRYITKVYLSTSKKNAFICYYDKPNLTSSFIVPMVLNYSLVEEIGLHTINYYSFIDTPAKLPESLFHVVRYGSSVSMKFEEKIGNYSMFLASKDLDKHHILLEYVLPKDLKKDLQFLVDGKYSQISESSKQRILNYYIKLDPDGMNPDAIQNSKIYGILYKTDTYRTFLGTKLSLEKQPLYIPSNLELGEAWEPIKETFLSDKMLDKNTLALARERHLKTVYPKVEI